MRLGALIAGTLGIQAGAVSLRHQAASAADAQSSSLFNAVQKRRLTKKAQLPAECEPCQGTMIDPFQESSKYCKANYDQCKCCQGLLEQEKGRICMTGKQGGGSFLGYGSCVDGIKAALSEKEKQCEHQKSLDDYNKAQRQKQINDALGDRSPYADLIALHKVNATSNTTAAYAPERYSSECISDCDQFDALCAFGYGCNKQLRNAEADLGTVKDWYGLYQNYACFR
eukprot:TRINITY_DN82416_c0_g1_i1.p1 TRINITY_DN82416_c0_g1~~TRINITY_DN82416_c0_g1_i1.p1  ORF type:complete len:227 (+),score=53.79 TRINITY_DN82416_c0_g1_i1:67-747(+)